MNHSGPNRTPQNGVRNDEDGDLSFCRIAPWNNKEEFVRVYQLLFGPNTTAASKRQACEYMRVWKIRRQYLTPASVLSTLTILDVHLQDDCLETAANNNNAVGDTAARHLVLRQLYAHSFTRFLNYMSSILQSRHMKTMYATAQELGLDSFLVDLRHLCAHGHDLPALDVFQRAVAHLLDWLHEFYWRRELEHIRDATVRDVRTTKAVEFEAYAESLLHVYDTATEALHRRCRLLSEIRGGQPFDEEQAWSLKKYGAYYKLDRLSVIAGRVTNELTQLAARESRVRGHDQIFCAALLRSRYFMESAAAAAVSEAKVNGEADKQQLRTSDLIGHHQNLFRALAVCGFIETCFHGLIAICEDEHETTVRRRGAQFWANQVAAGFQLFKEVKRAFKAKKERNSAFEMDLAPLNTDAMTPEILEVYRRLGVNCGGVLIFGDTIRRPWTLTLSRRYMNERAAVVNEYTRDVLVKCMGLVEPPLSADESEILRGLMAVMVASGTEVATSGDESTVAESSGPDDVYTVDEREAELRRLVAGEEMAQEVELVNEEGRQTFGIWSEVSDDFNWKSVPLGRVPWE